MKKSNILKKNWEFQKIINHKKQFISKFLILYYSKSSECQIGISIPKKFAIAVKRNYLKRQIRAIIDKNNLLNSVKFKIVLIVRKDFIDIPFEKKELEIIKIFEKLKKEQKK